VPGADFLADSTHQKVSGSIFGEETEEESDGFLGPGAFCTGDSGEKK
jgi:hypothetical protein